MIERISSRFNSKVCRRPKQLRSLSNSIILSDRRQPEVDFLHRWAVVWLKLSGKLSFKEKRKSAMKILSVSVKEYKTGEGITSG